MGIKPVSSISVVKSTAIPTNETALGFGILVGKTTEDFFCLWVKKWEWVTTTPFCHNQLNLFQATKSWAKSWNEAWIFEPRALIGKVNKHCTGFENFVIAHLSLCFYFSFFEHTEMIYRNLTSFAKPYKKLESLDKI